MMANKVSLIVFIYNSYKDPLFQNLILEYLKTLNKNGNYHFDLITFEQKQYALNKHETLLKKKELLKHNIFWHPQKFHTGKLLLLKKAWDVIKVFFVIRKLKSKFESQFILAFANVSAAMSVIFSKLLNLKLVIYSYEPHSHFLVDSGQWKENEVKYKVLNYLEQLAGKNATHVMTGTKHGVQLLKSLKPKGNIYRAPTAVNPSDFKFKKVGREQFRSLHNLSNKEVYLYIGKFGGIYYSNEIINMFEEILSIDPNSFLIIVSSHDPNIIQAWFGALNIPSDKYLITGPIFGDEIKKIISSADMGLSGIPPSLSQKYRSPTKVAEYLLCGLPYITCQGVSEDDEYAAKFNVGVVLKEFSKKEIRKNYSKIGALLDENKASLRDRCRTVGMEYRSKEHIDNLLSQIFQ